MTAPDAGVRVRHTAHVFKWPPQHHCMSATRVHNEERDIILEAPNPYWDPLADSNKRRETSVGTSHRSFGVQSDWQRMFFR
ncbi:hypothetical protein MAP00_001732 [Monascus purpureus]|nr:hypothetical protein MAP00_001732 [Monascus purpureus]